MKPRRLTAALLLAATCLAAPAASFAAQPNLVIFYADDLGWGELGCQGNPQIPTPNIDAIARNGVRFTNGYVAATYCSPSRAGLMTGRYPTRFGHEFNSVANRTGLRLDQVTLAERLRSLGYATACVGKWHLGGGLEYRPTRRGFDEFFGTLANTPFFHPTNFVDSRISDDVRPVTDPALRQRIVDECLVPYLLDGRDAWIMDAAGRYRGCDVQTLPDGHSAQASLMRLHGGTFPAAQASRSGRHNHG